MPLPPQPTQNFSPQQGGGGYSGNAGSAPPQSVYPPPIQQQNNYPGPVQQGYPGQSQQGGYPPPVGYPVQASPQQTRYAGAGYPAVAYPGSTAYAMTTTTTYTGYPPSYGYQPPAQAYAASPWTRPLYTYPTLHSPFHPFVVPVNLPPHLVGKMMQASAAFRMFDTNSSGYLSKREWKRALRHLGYFFQKGSAKALFYAVDTDHSGRVSEREFCEWWVHNNPY